MEKLYNNIILSDDFSNKMSNATDIPYLKNPPEIIDVTIGRQLFVDDFLIEETDLKPQHHKAKKFEGNPILYPQTSWEIEQSPVACPKSGGVWYDEEEKIFKMWYEAGWLHNMCYATSTDGIHWERPACIMNVTGPETVSIKKASIELGKYLGKEPIFENECGTDAYLNDASLAMETFGYPQVSAKTLIRWQAEWLLDGGRTLGKPTHFEERKGSY